jgi:cytochrome c553
LFGRRKLDGSVLLLIAVCVLSLFAGAQQLPRKPEALLVQAVPAVVPASPRDVATGMELFTGQRKFQNGGPACASCHSVATLRFPHGGTMAPDLTREYSKLGPEGMHYALRTLYFPAMNALFLKRQLTDQEERDLAAFFQNADRAQQLNSHTESIGGAAVLGLLVLVGITWLSGRGRVHSVRRNLLRRAGLYRESR